MLRPVMIASAISLLCGCVSNPGHYYSYEGGGDYYYEDAVADVVLDAYPYGYGWGGYAGFGYGGYYGYPWGYPYPPIWWSTPPIVIIDSPAWSPSAEDARAERVALSHRPYGDYPESATWARRDRMMAADGRSGLTNAGMLQGQGRVPVSAPAGQAPMAASESGAPTMSRSVSPAMRTWSRPSSGSRPMRSMPPPRSSGRKY